MSTKIYDAYRFKKCMSVQKAMPILLDFKAQAEELCRDKYTIFLCRWYWQLRDMLAYFKDDLPENDILQNKDMQYAMKYVVQDDREAFAIMCLDAFFSKYSFPNTCVHPFKSSIVVYPQKNKILLKFMGDSDFQSVFDDSEYLEDYTYQNSSDRPKTISPQAWAARRRAWDEVLGSDGVFMRHGLALTLTDPADTVFLSKILFNKAKSLGKYLEQTEKEYSRRISDIRRYLSCPLYDTCSCVNDFLDMEESPEYKEWKQTTECEIAAKLGIPFEEKPEQEA